MTIKRHLIELTHLGVPIVIAQLGTIVLSFADTMMVGQYGTLELSAASFVNNVFNLILFFLLGFSYSTTPVVGAAFGRNDTVAVGRWLRVSAASNLVVSLVIVALMLILYFNLSILDQPTELMPLIQPYYLIILASMPALALFNAFKQFCDAVGDTRSPMWVMILGNALNILGNYALIFGKLGCPELGLVGAGLATMGARVFMFLVMFLVICKGRRYASFSALKVLFAFHLPSCSSLRSYAHLAKIGLPISLQLCLEASSFNICAIFMGWLGTAPLAAHQIMCTIGTLCFGVYYGIGAAAAVRISHFCGQGNVPEVRRTAFTALGMAVGSGVLFCVFIHLFQVPLVSSFTTSKEVVSIVLSLLIPFYFYQLGDSIQTIFANALRAIEDVKYLMLYAFIAYLVISVPISYTMAFNGELGAVGIWWGFPFGLTSAGLMFLVRFSKWKQSV